MMQRRRFVQMMTLGGAGTLAALEVAKHAGGETKTISWRIKGFTCITCAVGLETMLNRRKGVRWVKATYPDAKVSIRYDPAVVSEEALRGFIRELGFTEEPWKES